MNCANCQTELSKKQTKFCSNNCKNQFKSLKAKEVFDQTKLYKCKINNKLFSLGALRSGAMKKYSKSTLNKEFDLNDWEIIDKPVDTSERWNCPYCDWSGKTFNGRDNGGWVSKHLLEVHGLDKVEHITRFSNDNSLWPVRLAREIREQETLRNANSQIKCEICNKVFRKISNSHLKTHNITEFEYKAKFGKDSLSSVSFKERMSDLYYQNDKMQSKLSRSKYEDELVNLFKEWNVGVEINNKNRIKTDLDLFIPEFNIAIEFNGLYWHSEYAGGKTEHYHLNKTKLCEQNNIHLIHIFEDEWVNKREIIISRLKNLVNKNENVIYARKCKIEEIDYKTTSQFINENHLQGSLTSAKVNLGLYYNDVLVSVMTFGKPRKATGNNPNTVNSWELQRFCNKLNYSVIGAASKLFKYFERIYKPMYLFSYADRRWTTTIKNSLYDNLGLTLTSKGSPNYWYLVEPMKRHHRFNFTKAAIIKKFKNADSNKSEWMNMIDLGFDRIWDCGSLKYEKYYSNALLNINISEPIEEIKSKPIKHRRKRKETTRNISDVECSICKNSFLIVGIATHFRLNHGLTVDEYVKKHGEYRPTKLNELKIKERSVGDFNCKLCGFECRGEKHLSAHVLKIHEMKKIDYVKTVILNNQIPKCKCGCGNEIELLSYQPYFREYLSGHNAKGENNPMFGKEHKKQSNIKMSGPRTNLKIT